jgi:DNA-binding NarL/FixJ family response regulator
MTDDVVLVASADRLFAAAAARYVEIETGRRAVTVSDGVLGLATVAQLRPSTVLVLGRLRRVAPQMFARQIERRWPGTRVVILADAGAEDSRSLPYMADAHSVLSALRDVRAATGTATHEVSRGDIELLHALTKRERSVLRLLAEGLEPDEIAERLSISRHTVRTHLQNLYRKLGLHRRVEVVHFAARHGLLGGSAHRDGG